MALRSGGTRYLRVPRPSPGWTAGRLPAVRVRVIQLRLLAGLLFALWLGMFVLLLVGYRPGGPADRLVAAAGALPALVALAAIVWPPVARGDQAHAGISWLALLAVLLLVPSMVGIVDQIRAGGPQTLLPSPEAAYPWLLALFATALFAGLGVARRRLGSASLRRSRLALGTTIAVLATAVVGSAFGGAAIANELALRDRVVASSRFGPTDPTLQPPPCDGILTAGRSAQLTARVAGEADGASMGRMTIGGVRDGLDVRWLGYAATSTRLGQYGVARLGDSAWSLAPGTGWVPTPIERVAGEDLDLQLLRSALSADNRVVAQMLGIDVIEGARARHCRVAVDGAMFRAAVPQVAFLVGAGDISRWRGELDYWVFADGELGQVDGRVNGSAADVIEDALLIDVTYRLTAVQRGADVTVARPER